MRSFNSQVNSNYIILPYPLRALHNTLKVMSMVHIKTIHGNLEV